MKIKVTRDMNVEDEGSARQFTKGETFTVVATVNDFETELSRGTADRLYRAGSAQMDPDDAPAVPSAASDTDEPNFVGGAQNGTPANRPIEGGLATGRAGQPEGEGEGQADDGSGKAGDEVDVDKLNKAELVEHAKTNGIAIDERANKADILAAIKAA